MDRKPKTPKQTNGERKPATQLLDDFMKENKITLQLSRPQVSFTNESDVIIKAPRIGAVYEDQPTPDLNG